MKYLAMAGIVVGLAAACSSFGEDSSPTPAKDGGTPTTMDGGSSSSSSGDAAPTRCAPNCKPRILAAKMPAIYGLAIDADFVYAGSDLPSGAVYRIAKSSGDVVTLQKALGYARHPALRGDVVYVGHDTGVVMVPRVGAPATPVVSVAQTALALDPMHLFACHYAGITTKQDVVRIDGTSATPVATIEGCESIATNDTYVVYGGSFGSGRRRVDGTTSAEMLGNFPARRLVLDGDDVYSIAFFMKDVRRMKVDASKPDSFDTIATLSDTNLEAGDLAVDETHVYFTVGKNPGKVYRAPKTGGVPEVIADELQNPCGIVVDHDAIYWSERETGLLWTREK